MANKKISAFAAAAALDGTEVAAGVQSGGNVKILMSAIKTYCSNAPTLVTPDLGVAIATSLAIGGATIGTNGLAVTGTALFNGAVTNTAAGAASAPGLLLSGAILTGGTGTTNFPHLFIQPSGATAATTWSTSGTALGVNAATGFAGNLIDLRVAGAQFLNVTSAGSLNIQGNFFIPAANTISFSTRGRIYSPGDGEILIRNNANNANANFTAAAGTFTGAIAIANTLNSVSPTSPNRTITMVVGGVTVYIAAKTTND